MIDSLRADGPPDQSPYASARAATASLTLTARQRSARADGALGRSASDTALPPASGRAAASGRLDSGRRMARGGDGAEEEEPGGLTRRINALSVRSVWDTGRIEGALNQLQHEKTAIEATLAKLDRVIENEEERSRSSEAIRLGGRGVAAERFIQMQRNGQ